ENLRCRLGRGPGGKRNPVARDLAHFDRGKRNGCVQSGGNETTHRIPRNRGKGAACNGGDEGAESGDAAHSGKSRLEESTGLGRVLRQYAAPSLSDASRHSRKAARADDQSWHAHHGESRGVSGAAPVFLSA